MAAPRKRCKTEREAGQNSAIKMMTEVGAVLEEGLAQAQTCKFLQLPHEAFLHIAAFLGPADVAALSRTCRKAHAIVSNGMHDHQPMLQAFASHLCGAAPL
jgi:hypothetical protein